MIHLPVILDDSSADVAVSIGLPQDLITERFGTARLGLEAAFRSLVLSRFAQLLEPCW
jgi:hypothetical protein